MSKKLGLALSSGGARGLVHIGVIKALLANNIKIDFVAGASAGAFVGGFYCSEGDTNRIEKIANDLNYRKFINHMRDMSIKAGVVRGNRIKHFIKEEIGNKKIEDCKVPIRIMTSDIEKGESVVLKEGLLASAIRAAISIPFVFKPVKIQDRLLVDGAVNCPVPVKEVKKMGAEVVIAVNLYDYESIINSTDKEISKSNPLRVGRLSLQVMLSSLAKETTKEADLVLTPKVGKITWKSINEADEYVKMGEKLVEDNLDKIKELLK